MKIILLIFTKESAKTYFNGGKKMKKNKITRSMCVFIAATMLPLETIVSLAAETAHTAVSVNPMKMLYRQQKMQILNQFSRIVWI